MIVENSTDPTILKLPIENVRTIQPSKKQSSYLPSVQTTDLNDNDDEAMDYEDDIEYQDSERDIGYEVIEDQVSQDYQSVTKDIIGCNNLDSDECDCPESDYKNDLEDDTLFIQRKLINHVNDINKSKKMKLLRNRNNIIY